MKRPLVTVEEAIANPVPYWLMAAYTYEEIGVVIMSDATFDALAQHIDDELMFINHPHAHLIDPHTMNSGTGSTKAREEWPTIIFAAAHRLLDEIYGRGWRKDVKGLMATSFDQRMAAWRKEREEEEDILS